MYKLLARLYLPFIRRHVKKLLTYTDLKIESMEFLGFSMLASICIAAFSALIISGFVGLALTNFALLTLGIFIVFQIAFYFLILLRADGKARFVESVLPDALQMIASNLKAGFTVDKAILLSIRPEFGALADELSIVGREITTGKQIDAAMFEMTKRVKSQKLSKTVSLIVYGIKSGGELAMLLNQTAQNLRNQSLVEERVRASVLMYFIFILSAVIFAAPLLFALSSYLAEVMITQLSALTIPQGVPSPITIRPIAISMDFIMGFIVMTIVTLCIFGSVALGMIKKGAGKEGVRYILPLIFMSLGLFFLVRKALSSLFSGII